MATLTSDYQYLGRSSVMTSVSGKLSYYLLLYGKTSSNPNTAVHSVTIRGRLSSTNDTSFYGYATSYSGTVAGMTAFSGNKKPASAWELSAFSEGGVKYKTGTDIASGTVNVDCSDGLAKDITLTFKWSMPSGSSDSYTPTAGTSRTVSVTATLPAIPRASKPSCITWPENTRDVGYFGDTIKIHMNSKSPKFTHKVYFSIGNIEKQLISTDVINNTPWTIPLDLISELSSVDKGGSGNIIVETYGDNGNAYIGSASCEFYAKVPDIEATKPKVTMTLNPVGALPPAFAGLYLQGLTKVKATLSAKGEYGANIGSYFIKLDNVLHDKDDAYTSSYLTSPGVKTVYGYATDSREITGETSKTINVIPYGEPRIENATAYRCDINGNEDDSGTYIRIRGKRSYSPCVSDGVQKNFCKIQYCHSLYNNLYSDWVTILDGENLESDEIITDALDGYISAEQSYDIHIRAIDDIGRTADTHISIPTAKVYMHRDGARNALGLGKYNEKENAVDSAWDIYMNGNKVTGLPDPIDDSDAVSYGFLKSKLGL